MRYSVGWRPTSYLPCGIAASKRVFMDNLQLLNNSVSQFRASEGLKRDFSSLMQRVAIAARNDYAGGFSLTLERAGVYYYFCTVPPNFGGSFSAEHMVQVVRNAVGFSDAFAEIIDVKEKGVFPHKFLLFDDIPDEGDWDRWSCLGSSMTNDDPISDNIIAISSEQRLRVTHGVEERTRRLIGVNQREDYDLGCNLVRDLELVNSMVSAIMNRVRRVGDGLPLLPHGRPGRGDYYHRLSQIEIQSGDKKMSRSVRDQIQRDAAKAKAKADKKATPKQFREREIKRLRDKRNGVELNGFKDIAKGALCASSMFMFVRFLRGANKLTNSVNDFVVSFKRYASMFKRNLGWLWLVPFIMVVKFFFDNLSTNGFKLALNSILPALLGYKVWNHISEYFPAGDTVLQAGFNGLPSLMSVLFTFSVFKGKVNASKVTEFCKRLSMFERMTSGWDAFLSWFMSSFETLVNFVRARFGKDRVKLFNNAYQPTLNWASKVDKLCELEQTGSSIDPGRLDQMVALLQEGYGYKELYRGMPIGRRVDEYVAKVANLLQPYLGSLNARNNFRFEPVSCVLYGAPGVGKTLLAVPFCSAILLKSGLVARGSKPEDIKKNLWQKGTSEYWNSYTGQLCLIMDDAFQGRANLSDKENDYMTFIRMIGSWSFPLNFADLASKGKVFFSSKFVYGTTNLSSIHSEASIVIQEPEAVARRINFGYELKVYSEYLTDNKLDYNKFLAEVQACKIRYANAPTGDPLDKFPWYIWYAQQHDYITGQTSGSVFGAKDLVEMISNEISNRLVAHDNNEDMIDDFINGFSDDIELQSGLFNRVKTRARYFKDELYEFMADFKRDHFLVTKAMKVGVFALGGLFAIKLVESLLIGLWRFLSGFFKRDDKRLHSNVPVVKRARITKLTDPRLQSGGEHVVSDNVYANTYKLINNTYGSIIGQVLFVEGDLAVMPEHYSDRMRKAVQSGKYSENDELILRNSVNGEHNISLTVKRFLSFKRLTDSDNDVEFVKFTNVRAHRKITSAFMTEKDIQYVGGKMGFVSMCEVDDASGFLKTPRRKCWVVNSIGFGRGLHFDDRRMLRYFHYKTLTEPGDCGAPFTIHDSKLFGGRCLMGLHCAGSTVQCKGYANVITREMVDVAISKLNVLRDDFIDDISGRAGIELQCGDMLPFDIKGSFLAIGTVNKSTSISPVTKYYRTRLYGSLGPHLLKPAHLSPVWRDDDKVYPMLNAVKPYSLPLMLFDFDNLRTVVHTAMRKLTFLTLHNSRSIYTFDEAILGIPSEKFRSIPRSTAAGFPYVFEVAGGKKEFFGEGDEYDLNTPKCKELRSRVLFVEEKARCGIRLSHVFNDFLKDELRSEQKVHDVATRLISSAPLDYTVLWRQYFGAFSSACHANFVNCGMAPGICAYTDWPLLCEFLRVKGDSVFDGDFKGFDASEQPQIHDAILDYINSWYDDGADNARIRSVLWLDLVHSRHIGGDGTSQKYIYQWNHSLPSGHPFTTIVNSMYSLILLVACYGDLIGNVSSFWNNVHAVTYGDDNVVNVHESIRDKYNLHTVMMAMMRYGVVYTSGAKQGVEGPYKVLTEATFLKRGFKLRSDRWVCPLELESFLFTHYWCKNKKLEDKIMVDVLEVALEELSMHESELWDFYAPAIQRILLEEYQHVTNVPLDQGSYMDLVCTRGDAWY